jgi:D-lactate dehydrogenase (cytochrome)
MAVRGQHANTTTWVAPSRPDAVVFPQSTNDVQQIVRICAHHQVPMIPFGAGTFFEGSVNAPFGLPPAPQALGCRLLLVWRSRLLEWRRF